MNKIIKIVLHVVFLGTIVFLAYMLYESIMEPIRFQEQYDKRKAAIVNRLKQIRDMQVAYKAINNKYTGSFDTLIDFAKNGNMKLVKMEGSLSDSLLKEGWTEAKAIKAGIIKRDTVYVAIKDTLCKEYDPDSLRFVPFTDNQKFEMGASSITTSSGLVIPVFEASVTNRVFLKGLDNQQRINMDKDAEQLGRFPGLKVGSLEEANNNAGNWE